MALQIPFANTGDRKPISQGQSADGSVSWEKGFTSLYALAPQDGGKFIDRQEFNQIVYEISEATIENSQATAELIDDGATSTAKTWSSNKISSNIQAIETQIATQGSKLLTANVSKTVGASGADFKTLGDALKWCLQYGPNQAYTITLKCNADMAVPGVLNNLNGDINYVTIDGQGNTWNITSGTFLRFHLSLKIQNFNINASGITGNYSAAIITVVGDYNSSSCVYIKDCNFKLTDCTDYAAITTNTNSAFCDFNGGNITITGGSQCHGYKIQNKAFARVGESTVTGGAYAIDITGGALCFNLGDLSCNLAKNTPTASGINFA